MATSWYPPLPPNWEARWDPNQKAYFYIDHVNKQTTWEDPRFHKPTQNQAAQALSPGGASHHAHRGQGHQGEAIPMRDMQRHGHTGHAQQQDTGFSRVDNGLVQKIKATLPTCPDNVIKQALLKNQNNYGQTVHELQAKGYTKDQPVLQLSNTPAARLKELFPVAPAGIIQDVLAMCGNNEDEAKDQLIDLGFDMSRTSGRTSRAVSPNHSPRHHDSSGHSPRHSHSGQRRQSGNHSRQATSPHRPQMSESEKERMKTKLYSEFPNVSKDIIQMALEATSYNEESTKRVLTGTYSRIASSANRVSSATSSSSATTHDSRSTTSSHLAPSRHVTNAGLEPVAFPDDRPESRPGSSHTSSSRETTPSRGQGQTQHRQGTTQQQQKAKQVTKMSEQLLTTTNDMLNHLASSCCMREGEENASDQSESRSDSRRNRAKVTTTVGPAKHVVTAQPKKYTSPYRTQPNGPNPALRKGQDESLQLPSYTRVQGPNLALRSGPDPSRVQGSQGARGPDPSLRCGPQSNLHSGPSTENLTVGSGVLVTAI